MLKTKEFKEEEKTGLFNLLTAAFFFFLLLLFFIGFNLNLDAIEHTNVNFSAACLCFMQTDSSHMGKAPALKNHLRWKHAGWGGGTPYLSQTAK